MKNDASWSYNRLPKVMVLRPNKDASPYLSPEGQLANTLDSKSRSLDLWFPALDRGALLKDAALRFEVLQRVPRAVRGYWAPP